MKRAGSNVNIASRCVLEHALVQSKLDSLRFEHLTAAAIPAQQPVFGDALRLDSLDALKPALVLPNQYSIRIEADAGQSRRYFASTPSLPALVRTQQAACAD